jgi:glycosyltransferase involved in cell wall biosynthesis
MTRSRFIVYGDELLRLTDSYVLGQAESMPNFRAMYVGFRRNERLPMQESRVHILGGGGPSGLSRARFKLVGPGRALLARLAAKSPALVHAHFAPDAFNAIRLAKSLHVPLVVSLHGNGVMAPNFGVPWFYTQGRGQLQSSCSKFICVSEFVRRQAVLNGVPAEKTVVHHPGIDLDFYRREAEVVRSPLVLFAGRLVPENGCEDLVRAMARVQAEMPQARLVVIGAGPERPRLELRAESTLRNFQFLGEQPSSVLREWMNRATVFGGPCLAKQFGEAESFETDIMKAQAMGLPVVAYASEGIPETVAQGRTGLLGLESDLEALGENLLIVLRDDKLWRRMSDAAQYRAQQLFNIHAQARTLEAIYESAVSDFSRARVVRENRRSEGTGRHWSPSVLEASKSK